MSKYFSFTRNQKVGVISLLGIILVLTILLNVNFHRGLETPVEVNRSSLEYLSLINGDTAKSIQSNNQSSGTSIKKHELFNPNNLSAKGWEDRGFSSKQANVIVNYKNNYGPFNKAEDVQKIYVISEDKFNELQPFMIFDEVDTSANLGDDNRHTLVNLNLASRDELESIRGIGPVLSERIVKYRSSLGGFSSQAQFNEVYGLKGESLEALKENVIIDLQAIQQIKINTATKTQIKSHPYLKDWSVVAAILSHRDKAPLTNLNFLISESLLSEEELNRILPYINFTE